MQGNFLQKVPLQSIIMLNKIASHPLLPDRFRQDTDLPGRLAVIAESLMETNKKFNLTAITDPEAVAKHIPVGLLTCVSGDFLSAFSENSND